MALALFDLDHTLIAGDYLAERGLVDADYQARKHGYYADYCAGRLDYPDFARFVLEPLARLPIPELLHLRAGYAQDKLRPMLLAAVSRPVAVDPDARLRAHAQAAGWPILSFREG